MNVGLCWAGGPLHRNDRNRSMQFTDWLPLFRLPVHVHSLQVGDRANEWRDVQDDTLVIQTPLDGCTDWMETARVIRSLDLVLTVDTAVLHLAGAMGKPTWAALAAAPDFRWGLQSTSTPWYPSLTLYRQAKAGSWGDVVHRMISDLEAMLCAK